MQNRRDLLKQGIIAITATLLPVKAIAEEESATRYQMIVDQNCCMGCQTCVWPAKPRMMLRKISS
ncbi:hypothetical protein SRRS_46070 [Sporomusa rhizae]|uniref:hypothetical protein n=1 Tax=Sporomusa rhizae TaxID=357999 RepID=UPI003529DE77